MGDNIGKNQNSETMPRLQRSQSTPGSNLKSISQKHNFWPEKCFLPIANQSHRKICMSLKHCKVEKLGQLTVAVTAPHPVHCPHCVWQILNGTIQLSHKATDVGCIMVGYKHNGKQTDTIQYKRFSLFSFQTGMYRTCNTQPRIIDRTAQWIFAPSTSSAHTCSIFHK